MSKNAFFKEGNWYKDRKRKYQVIKLEEKPKRMLIRYELSNEEEWLDENSMNLKKRIIENMEEKIWLVAHTENLWDIDNRLIGFSRKQQWDKLNVGDIVIYYRLGERNIKGVFKIVKKGINLNPDFNIELHSGPTQYQFRLELLNDEIICNNRNVSMKMRHLHQ